MDLFGARGGNALAGDVVSGQAGYEPDSLPLAERLRPKCLDDVVGAEHILGKGKALRVLIEADRVPSMILYGKPGTGKTTIARVIARVTSRRFYTLNAVMSGVADIRKVVEQAQLDLKTKGKRSILFIDEIHRFNKGQQDALLPYVEGGVITLVGATTENPMFCLNGPLISRIRIIELNPLSDDGIACIVRRGLDEENSRNKQQELDIEAKALERLVRLASGDARVALNLLETACLLIRGRNTSEQGEGRKRATIDVSVVEEAAGKTVASYDRTGDNHYDIASALIKSIRGSDPQAAVYWLGRMIYGGEDPRFIARRLVISASEDVGMANPTGLLVAQAAAEAVERVGMPEARIVLAHAAIFLATSMKSNSACAAIDRVLAAIENGASYQVPEHLRDANYRGAMRLGRGRGYKYPHDYPEHYVKQEYLPDELAGTVFYSPSENGYERKAAEWIRRLTGDKASVD